VLINVTFEGNAANDSGAGIYNEQQSAPTLTNVTMNNNKAINFGGGIINSYSSNPLIRNTILWGNAPDQVHNDSSAPVIDYSVVQDGCPAGSTCSDIITADPRLVYLPISAVKRKPFLSNLAAQPLTEVMTATVPPPTSAAQSARRMAMAMDTPYAISVPTRDWVIFYIWR